MGVCLVVKLFLRLDQRETSKIIMSDSLYTMKPSLSSFFFLIIIKKCVCNIKQNANSGLISLGNSFQVVLCTMVFDWDLT